MRALLWEHRSVVLHCAVTSRVCSVLSQCCACRVRNWCRNREGMIGCLIQEYSSLPTYGRSFIFWFLLFHITHLDTQLLTGLSVSPVTKSKSHAMNTSEHI